MGLFGDILNLGVDAVKLPFNVAGEIAGLKEDGTSKENVKDISQDVEDAIDDFLNGDFI